MIENLVFPAQYERESCADCVNLIGMTTGVSVSPLTQFKTNLAGPDLVDRVRDGLIGETITIDGPFGPRPLVYADYVASGRALAQVEDFVRDAVLPYYANTHTQASFCGSYMTQLREKARREIARITGAGAETSVIFCGAGVTAGINRVVGLLNIPEVLHRGGRAVVLIGPYEHHSNILPWRESGAEVIEIAEARSGGPDMVDLEQALKANKDAALIVGAFAAASNVTGILCDTNAITAVLKRHGALAVWDYGCAGPYVPMEMNPSPETAKDAILFSPHKFPGGPGASGVAVIREDLSRRKTPTQPGGGTVTYVSPWEHIYSDFLSEREEGGTPNVIGDIRAALALLVKEALGTDWLAMRQEELRARAEKVWARNPRIELLGNRAAKALPIFSFRIGDGEGGHIHHQFFTRLLSDQTGVQARGGCACAGPYGHRLLGIDRAASEAMLAAISAGHETEKPGWVRLNFSALMRDEKVDYIIHAVDKLAWMAPDYLDSYVADTGTARFKAAESRTHTAPEIRLQDET